mgnify:CR=1 FL=1
MEKISFVIMKYTIDETLKTVTIDGSFSADELKTLCEKYPDYLFSGSNFAFYPYVPSIAPTTVPTIAPYYNPYFGTMSVSRLGTAANLHGYSNGSSTDTTQGFAGKTTTD